MWFLKGLICMLEVLVCIVFVIMLLIRWIIGVLEVLFRRFLVFGILLIRCERFLLFFLFFSLFVLILLKVQMFDRVLLQVWVLYLLIGQEWFSIWQSLSRVCLLVLVCIRKLLLFFGWKVMFFWCVKLQVIGLCFLFVLVMFFVGLVVICCFCCWKVDYQYVYDFFQVVVIVFVGYMLLVCDVVIVVFCQCLYVCFVVDNCWVNEDY